jgi:hypothetical protein
MMLAKQLGAQLLRTRQIGRARLSSQRKDFIHSVSIDVFKANWPVISAGVGDR